MASTAAKGEPAGTGPRKLPTLTTAMEAHSLSLKEAARGYPVHLRAVVTYYDPYLIPLHTILFIHDASGGIYVSLPPALLPAIPAGSLVDVLGVSAPGEYAPIVDLAQVTVIGSSHLPEIAPRVSLTRLLTGAEDGQWVEADGVIRSIFETVHGVTLQLAMTDGTISVSTVREPGASYSGLVDAKVRIHANAVPWFNGNHQMTGARLMFPGRAAMKVLEPAPTLPFDLPTLPIESLSRFDPRVNMAHRIHVRGTVTLQWPGSSLCIRNGTQSVCAQTIQPTRAAVGDVADVVGFPGPGDSAPILTDAVFMSSPSYEAVLARPVTAGEALSGPYEAKLIEIDGLLIGRDLAASDTTLVLSSGNFIFAAVLPKSLIGPEADTWKNGSKLRITGICSVQGYAQSIVRGSERGVAKSFRVLLRSPQDVIVVQGPSWWTPSHALLLLGLGFTGTLVVLGRVVGLSKRVEQQRNLIRESEERYRHLAQHDALTGLPTRVLLHDRLNAALERSRRYQTSVALLMLDLDNFKLINDSLGHQAGDLTLRVTAERINEAVRKSDTVARMGGDEFIVLLPDLHDSHEAEAVAAKVVRALSVPILIGDREVPVSVSVGVCTAYGGLDADGLLRGVDIAMYQAKAKGRNRFQVFTPMMAQAQPESYDHRLVAPGR